MIKLLKKIYRFLLIARKRVRNLFIPTAYIVLYHRVAKTGLDPHFLCVEPEVFREQLKFFKENFNIMPLGQIVKWIKEGKLKHNSLAITFDDGYADNLHNALPILKELNVPATIFVTSEYIDSSKPFYWDIEVQPQYRGKSLTSQELIQLANSSLIEISAHTMTHPKLKTLSLKGQEIEIKTSRESIEKIIGKPLIGFAYPFGGLDSFDRNTIEIIKAAGFSYACANIHERVTNNSDLFALPRFIARNQSIEDFKKEVKRWH